MSKRPLSSSRQNVNVFVRLRDDDNPDGPTIIKNQKEPIITTISPQTKEKRSFQFTDVFTSDDDNSKIFKTVARPLLDNFIVKNKNGVIFTYGRTGAGKTFTMEGDKDDGLVYRTFNYIFNSIGLQQTQKGMVKLLGDKATVLETGFYPTLIEESVKFPSVKQAAKMWGAEDQKARNVDTSKQYCVYISIVELYLKELRDLLPTDKRQKIELSATDSHITGASQHEVKSADEAARLYKTAKSKRKTLKTTLNENSSRGHLVLIIRLVRVDSTKNIIEPIPQFCLVDLAGCERTKQSCVSGSGLQEACSINYSLGALRLCIKNLKDNTRVQYRTDNLTKLLRRYFEGNGTISMILCIKPDSDTFKENLYAMEFGTQTRDVRMDYASPPKQRSTKEEIKDCLLKMMAARDARREQRKRDMELAFKMQKEFRTNLLALLDERSKMQDELQKLKSDNGLLKTELEAVELEKKELKQTIHYEVSDKEYYAKRLEKVLKYLSTVAPSAPMQSSSPIPGPSTTESTESHTDPLTNSSGGTMEYHRQADDKHHSPSKLTQGGGVPVVNPRHNRSLSCSSLQWIHHKPKGTIDTGTVLKPKFKNGRSVKKLRSSDILRRDAGGYSVVHQDADDNGEVETKVYKGHIISTVCGGAQVILDDIETMKQASPKTRRRAASEVHYDY